MFAEAGIVEPVTQWFAMDTPGSKQSGLFEVTDGWSGAHAGEGLYSHNVRSPSGVGCPYVPLLEKPGELSPQPEFLYCQISRAYMHCTPQTRLWEDGQYLRIIDEKDNVIVSLSPSGKEDADQIQDSVRQGNSTVLELVAVYKGWIKMSQYSPSRNVPEERQVIFQDFTGQSARDCYFVLWIEWEDGVALRKAAGEVVVEAWEDLKEEELVDLTLG
ncbi:Fc.00g004720.m01.CDS01 [Cosmosporella sp. VM-42]